MATTIDVYAILNGIEAAYDIFGRQLKYEILVVARIFDLNAGTSTDCTFLGLQVNKDILKVNDGFSLVTQNSPVVYVLNENIPIVGGIKLYPNFSWQLNKLNDSDNHRQSIQGINQILPNVSPEEARFQILRLQR